MPNTWAPRPILLIMSWATVDELLPLQGLPLFLKVQSCTDCLWSFFQVQRWSVPRSTRPFLNQLPVKKYSPINNLKTSSFEFNSSSWQACVPSGNPRKSFISFPLYGNHLYSLAYGTFLHLQACNVASSDLSLSITLISIVRFWPSCFHLVSTFVITSIN